MSIYPEKVISRCQSLAKNKKFICEDCKWSEDSTKTRAYCGKVGFECNGDQSSPVQWCEDFELKEASHG